MSGHQSLFWISGDDVKYIALQYFSGGMRVIADDLDKDQPLDREEALTEDSWVLTRKLYYFLMRNGYQPDNRGVIHVIAFGVLNMDLMVGMITLPRYIEFEGGLLNPNLLTWNSKNMEFREGSHRVDMIIEMVRASLKG